MSKQVQDAYIVAATRTPIGRSRRGFFRNTRPDDLLVAAIRSALAQVPALDPAAIEDAIIGCAIPEARAGPEHGAHRRAAAGLPEAVGGITVNRFCASGLSAVQMAADRIRVGEADVMIAAGAESMSMVPMRGNSPSFTPRDLRRATRTSASPTAWASRPRRWRSSGRSSREAQDEFALAVAPEGAGAQAGRRVRRRDHADRGDRPLARPGDAARPATTHPHRHASTKARAPTPRSKAWPSCSRCSPPGAAVTAGNSSQTSDGAGALILASERPVKRSA